MWHRSHWAKIKVSAGLVPPGGSGENPFPCPLQLLGALHSLAHGPFLCLKSQQCGISLTLSPSLLSSPPPSSTFKDPCDYIGLVQILQDTPLT